MKVLIIGADGYMGWPLACQIANQPQVRHLVLLDNCITREKVRIVGSNSVVPIRKWIERGDILKSQFPEKNIQIINDTVLNQGLIDELTKQKFDVIYHLGHLRTAPYSMSSKNACIETVTNNEIGFLNLVWSLKENSRDTLLVKLGSFGAYAPTGLEIPETDITLHPHKGEQSQIKVPYPKYATDFYHITKANDSLFARAACKNWSLKIIDVMQSTVFGCYTEHTNEINENTRFDYDEVYGTVVNRFLVQGLLGQNLSVYGDGEHSSGIMVLEDAINVLTSLRNIDVEPGEYKIINNNPRSYKINELADMVKSVLIQNEHVTDVSFAHFDPRNEKANDGKYCVTTADSGYFNLNFEETPIVKEIERSIEIVKPHLSRVIRGVIYPKLDWSS